jgi:hypothetical protein
MKGLILRCHNRNTLEPRIAKLTLGLSAPGKRVIVSSWVETSKDGADKKYCCSTSVDTPIGVCFTAMTIEGVGILWVKLMQSHNNWYSNTPCFRLMKLCFKGDS